MLGGRAKAPTSFFQTTLKNLGPPSSPLLICTHFNGFTISCYWYFSHYTNNSASVVSAQSREKQSLRKIQAMHTGDYRVLSL